MSRQVASPGKPLPARAAREGLDRAPGGNRLLGGHRLDGLIPVAGDDGGPVPGLVLLRGTRRRHAVDGHGGELRLTRLQHGCR